MSPSSPRAAKSSDRRATRPPGDRATRPSDGRARREPTGGDRRSAILDAAIAVIARRGVRGLRVEEVAAEAGVATSLLYYYFANRNGLVRATLDHANERAERSVHEDATGRAAVERSLLAELEDGARATSVVWGEVLASAVFEPDLRDQLNEATGAWNELIATAIRAGVADGSIPGAVEPQAAAERLTALVEGLSARWLAGITTRERARQLLAAAVTAELG
jgi:AcrR family transcriptional regulator